MKAGVVAAMTSTDESDSLISALNKARIPSGNHAFIRQIVNGVLGTSFG